MAATGSALVVGMDPIPALLPPELAPPDGAPPAVVAERFMRFAGTILEALADLVVAVKFQSAYYERLGRAGLEALLDSLAHARAREILTIVDGKRGDIGSTAAAYAEAYLGDLPETCGPLTDAVTVNPYLGEDGIRPFVDVAADHDKGLFVLVKTSNPSGPRLQDLRAGDMPVYLHVAELVTELGRDLVGTCGLSGVGAVVGATYPRVLAELRTAMPYAVFLLPGVGAQGGAIADLAPAFLPGLRGALITCSRSLIYAYRRRDGLSWQEAARAEATELLTALSGLPR
jgi:orotidine-5'-phosphate decarboxylase